MSYGLRDQVGSGGLYCLTIINPLALQRQIDPENVLKLRNRPVLSRAELFLPTFFRIVVKEALRGAKQRGAPDR